jgi:hypothetical protein
MLIELAMRFANTLGGTMMAVLVGREGNERWDDEDY